MMDDQKFTSGPWECIEGLYSPQSRPDRWHIRTAYEVTDSWHESYKRDVAHMATQDNAHLIAAAPQLYDVVAWLISERDNGTDKGLLPDGLLNAARIAIAKAEGETNA